MTSSWIKMSFQTTMPFLEPCNVVLLKMCKGWHRKRGVAVQMPYTLCPTWRLHKIQSIIIFQEFKNPHQEKKK